MEDFLHSIDPSIPIIVEGKRDKAALGRLGVSNVHTLQGPLYSVAERFKDQKSVIILTDLDKKGRMLYGRLKKDFSRMGVKVDDRLRTFIIRETPLSHIEGIATYVKNLGK